MVSIDFLHDTKESKFIYFTLGWLSWICAAIFPIFLSIAELYGLTELFLVLNIIFAVIGTVFYMWGFLKYYLIVPFKIMVLIIVISVTIPILLYLLINANISIQFSALFLNILLISAYVIPPIKKRKFKQFMGKSMRWYYATTFLFIIYFPLSILTFSSG
jgi:hypothetical protein